MSTLNTSAVTTLLRLPRVTQATGIARSTLYKHIQRGIFPKPISIGGDRVAWPAHEVQTLINARIAGKSDDEVKQVVLELEAARKAA